MSTLSMTFAQKADERDQERAVVGASLQLLVADTRQGMDAQTKAARDLIGASGDPKRKGYLERYAAAAGRSATPRAATQSTPQF